MIWTDQHINFDWLISLITCWKHTWELDRIVVRRMVRVGASAGQTIAQMFNIDLDVDSDADYLDVTKHGRHRRKLPRLNQSQVWLRAFMHREYVSIPHWRRTKYCCTISDRIQTIPQIQMEGNLRIKAQSQSNTERSRYLGTVQHDFSNCIFTVQLGAHIYSRVQGTRRCRCQVTVHVRPQDPVTPATRMIISTVATLTLYETLAAEVIWWRKLSSCWEGNMRIRKIYAEYPPRGFEPGLAARKSIALTPRHLN